MSVYPYIYNEDGDEALGLDLSEGEVRLLLQLVSPHHLRVGSLLAQGLAQVPDRGDVTLIITIKG